MARVVFAFALIMTLSLDAFGWGSVTHVYIARRIFPNAPPELLLGAMAPDMFDFEFFNRKVKSETKRLMDREFDRLPLSAFALGVMTHNALWGADAYAHAYGKPNAEDRFPKTIFEQFSRETGMSVHDAEDWLEATLDYVIRVHWGPDLADVFARCGDAANAGIERMLVAAYAGPLTERVPGLSHQDAETALHGMFNGFACFMRLYAELFRMSDADLSALAPRIFQMALGGDQEVIEQRFHRAVELCAGWKREIDAIADDIAARMNLFRNGIPRPWRRTAVIVAACLLL